MRIVGGTLKGRTFIPPRGFSARPTTDFAKESLFNILANRIDFEGLAVLDLFAGTGSISYEFASRGAARIVAVELDYFHNRFIRSCIRKLGVDTVHVLRQDAFRYAKRAADSFDLIFADPPYNHSAIAGLPALILESSILSPDGLFILEHSGKYNFSDSQFFVEKRTYGSVNFTFFSKKK